MGLKIIYFGKDEVFLNALKTRALEGPQDSSLDIESMHFDDIEGSDVISKVLPEIISKSPNIIMVDFSYESKKIITLARHLRLSLEPRDYTLIGLLNQAANENHSHRLDFLQATMTQFPIIHYKGIDPSLILYDALYMHNMDNSFRQTYAIFNNLKREVEAKYYSTITHFLDEALVIETSLNFSVDQIIKVESKYLPHINNKFLKVEKSSTEQLQTKYSKKYRLKNNFEPSREEENHLTQIDNHTLKNYVESLDKTGSNKNIKVLLVQDGLEILSQFSENLSSLPYLVRYQTNFRNELTMVSNFRPNIISLELTPKPEELAEGVTPKEVELITLESLSPLIGLINSIEGYKPFINIFNCPNSSAELREKTSYPQILTINERMNFDLILSMLELFKKKFGEDEVKSTDPLIKDDDNAYNIYALNTLSRIMFDLPIQITSISEHELTFLSDQALPVRGVIRVKLPIVKFYITIAPVQNPLPDIDGKQQYLGLINGINTIELQALRQYVNSLFLEEKMKKEEDERKAYIKTNADAELAIKERAKKKKEDDKKKDEESEN